MLTLEEVLSSINEAISKRDFLKEYSPENKEFFSRRNGTFEAVLTGKGDEKYLIPEVGSIHYLYRGQNEEFTPCIPTLYRGNPSDVQIFLNRLRLMSFKELLSTHPVVKGFFKKHHFYVDEVGLAQHYGIKTEVLDLTSSIDVALFFATCKYNADSDSYEYFDDDKDHQGILYVFDPLRDNEPTPPLNFENYMRGKIKPIGLQAFPRPGQQRGYSLHLEKGKSIKCWMYTFSFTSDDSKRYYEMFNEGNSLWVKDDIVAKTKDIINQMSFPFSLFNEAFKEYKPKGWSRKKLLIALRNAGASFSTKCNNIVFSQEEIQQIIKDWNEGLGEKTAQKIVRKQWYETEGHDNADNEGKNNVKIKTKYDYVTMKHLSDWMRIIFVSNPDGPKGAEWRNYTGEPTSHSKTAQRGCGLTKVEASMTPLLGRTYLTEADWHID